MKVKRAEHLATCGRLGQLPAGERPEIAFLGRSNVGKSSLLNRLVARKQLARTSGTPGKTRLIHIYEVEIGSAIVRLVDLPGYGYARVSQAERKSWQALVEGYLEAREALAGAILLHDLRRDPTEDETLLLEWLAERDIPPLVALTKCDKLKPMRRAERVRKLAPQLPLAKQDVIATSAQTGLGTDVLWKAIYARIS